MLRFECPHCGKQYQLPDASGGKTAKCQACGGKFRVPEAPSAEPPAESQQPPAFDVFGDSDSARSPAKPGEIFGDSLAGQGEPYVPPESDTYGVQSSGDDVFGSGLGAPPPPPPNAYGPPLRNPTAPRPPGKKSSNTTLYVVIAVVAVAFLAAPIFCCCCGGFFQGVMEGVADIDMELDGPYWQAYLVLDDPEYGRPIIEDAPKPGISPPPTYVDYKGVRRAVVRLGRGQLYVYLPKGSHEPGSLPCVFVAPAGAPPFSGMNLAEGDVPEHLPYVEAGFAVVAYSLDGYVSEAQQNTIALPNAALPWANSYAGLVNLRDAIDYSADKVPEIDQDRLYTAGHSSAGAMAIRGAVFDTRIKGCAAYAPSMGYGEELYYDPEMEAIEEDHFGWVDFIDITDPTYYSYYIECPVFIHCATADQPIHDCAREFVQEAKENDCDATFVSVRGGDHYDTMIEDGLPAGVEWLKKLDAKQR